MSYDHVRHYVDWASRPDGAVWCVVTTSQPSAGAEGAQRYGISSYAEGELRRDGGDALAGELTQYFSDRRQANHPFDPDRSERLAVIVGADASSGQASVELVARAWGDARQTLSNLRVEDGVLVGDGGSVGQQTAAALYSVALGTVVVPG